MHWVTIVYRMTSKLPSARWNHAGADLPGTSNPNFCVWEHTKRCALRSTHASHSTKTYCPAPSTKQQACATPPKSYVADSALPHVAATCDEKGLKER